MTDLNLRELVRDVLRTSTMADPRDVAAEVMKRLKPRDYHGALEQALYPFVLQVNTEERSVQTRHLETTRPRVRSGRSTKVTRIREGWQRALSMRVNVNGDVGWRFLKDCTYEDLTYAATERRALAERNAAVARRFTYWASLLTEHEVATFGDLPAEVLQQVLGEVAA